MIFCPITLKAGDTEPEPTGRDQDGRTKMAGQATLWGLDKTSMDRSCPCCCVHFSRDKAVGDCVIER